MPLLERVENLRNWASEFINPRLLISSLKTDQQKRAEIKELYSLIFKKELTGCINCFSDALFEILNTKKITEMSELLFDLRAGALIPDPAGDNKKNLTRKNLTNELALYHINAQPKVKERFSKLPNNLDELLKEYQKKIIEEQKIAAKAGEDNAKDVIGGIFEKQAKIEELLKQNGDLAAQLESKIKAYTELKVQYDGLVASNSTTKELLEKAESDIVTLKGEKKQLESDIAALKEKTTEHSNDSANPPVEKTTGKGK